MGERITLAGNIIVDNVKTISAWPEKGMLVPITAMKRSPGGAVPNSGIDLKILDPSVEVAAVGKVGADDAGGFVTAFMEERGLDVSGVRRVEGVPTSFTDVMTLAKTGERTFFNMHGADSRLVPDDIDPAELGAVMLAIFGLAVILYAVVSITGSILQAFGKVNMPLVSLVVGGIVKCILTAALVSTPSIGIIGAPIATCICYIVMIFMNFFFLRKFMKGSVKRILVNFIKTLVATVLMGGAAYLVYTLLSSKIDIFASRTIQLVTTIAFIGVAVVVYVAAIFLFKVVTPGELKETLGRRKKAKDEPEEDSDLEEL